MFRGKVRFESKQGQGFWRRWHWEWTRRIFWFEWREEGESSKANVLQNPKHGPLIGLVENWKI